MLKIHYRVGVVPEFAKGTWEAGSKLPSLIMLGVVP